MTAGKVQETLQATEEIIREVLASPGCDSYAHSGLSSRHCLEHLLGLVARLRETGDDASEEQQRTASELLSAVLGLRDTVLALAQAAD